MEPLKDILFFPLMRILLWLLLAYSVQCVAYKALPFLAQFYLLLFPTPHANNQPHQMLGCMVNILYSLHACLVNAFPQHKSLLLGNICQLPRVSLFLPSNP